MGNLDFGKFFDIAMIWIRLFCSKIWKNQQILANVWMSLCNLSPKCQTETGKIR